MRPACRAATCAATRSRSRMIAARCSAACLPAARAGSFASVLRQGFGATLLDAEKLCAKFLPDTVPDDFGALQVPLTVMASDLHRREPVAFSHGPLRRALAASIALPTLVRP